MAGSGSGGRVVALPLQRPGDPLTLATLQQVLLRHLALVRGEQAGLPLLEMTGLQPFEL